VIDVEATARSEVEAALVTLGLHATSVDLVSPLGPRKGTRFAYRVATADGLTVKARHLGTSQDADRLRALRRDLEPAFAAVLDRSGAVLVEEWVAGTSLCELDATPWFEPAGALLGRLHATQPVAGATSTRSWTEAACSDLALLEDAEELTATEASLLRDRLHATDPGTARLGLIHKDFCADNIVIDRAGALRVIDNELLDLDPIGFDLGRTFHLWPMDDDAWRAFHRGYQSAAPPAPDATVYWRIVAALVGGRVFLTRSRIRLEETVDLLLGFVDGELRRPPP
jgi:Ser/Thr protein kinase RdoA (MazF antagonist)